MNRMIGEATCKNCGATHVCERNEDGEPELDLRPCHDDGCTARLCQSCEAFQCDGCELDFCTSHMVELAGLKLCKVCADLTAADDDGSLILADPESVERIRLLAEAGMSLTQARAYSATIEGGKL